MADRYKNKYRTTSHRKLNWDYNSAGAYFITICTQNRECNLGEIVKNKDDAFLQLSEFGKIVAAEWHKSFEIRKELYCDEYILMPNHIHAIIILENDMDGNGDCNGNADADGIPDADGNAVQTHGRASLRESNELRESNKSPSIPHRLPKSISSFIAGFKSAVNSKIDDYIDENKLNIPKYNRNNHFFQPNYHDHIIKDNTSFQRIKNYIINNPKNWDTDKFRKSNSKK